MEKGDAPQLLTPASVTATISRVETAQLTRAQEDISTQLSDILNNVNSVINSLQEESGYDLKEKTKSYQMEQKVKKRFILLEKISSFSKDAKTKEKHLYEILCWLGDWGDSLTYEIRNRKSEDEEEALNEWIEKSSPHLQPPSPEQMLQDKHATCVKVSEVKSMLQELLDSTMFNKGEVKAIRYMSTVVENLNKALILQHKENRSLETKYKCLQIEMVKEPSSQRLHFQKSIQDLGSQRDALLKQRPLVTSKEKMYHMDMEAQRKNLQLLSGESKLELPNYLHSKALELTTTTMEPSAHRLPYLCQKYVIYRHFQSLRQAVINHKQVMGETTASYKAQSLVVFLENIDCQQKLRLQAWSDKQKDLEKQRRECLSSMVTMFPKLRLEWNIHLNIPVVISSKPKKCKSPSALPRWIHSSSPTCKQSFPPSQRECVPLWTPRKECQEHTEEPTELVCKKLSQSLPGTLQSQKELNRNSSSPHSIPQLVILKLQDN
ncbi:Protein FAM186B [Heterocephalus glaber]|uniref:Protein FAM186B n=1 Tax=Heterocephalus glaber TaxID=10181 RepID=G5AU16_HETGA|nr:Protein FAM186B [Heterocephalus glaber]